MMNLIDPDLLIIDEADMTDLDLHPWGDWTREQMAIVSQETMTREQLLDRRKQEIAHPEWW